MVDLAEQSVKRQAGRQTPSPLASTVKRVSVQTWPEEAAAVPQHPGKHPQSVCGVVCCVVVSCVLFKERSHFCCPAYIKTDKQVRQ